ncbi:MAG: glycine--tRNA ligase subunit beta [Rhodospirillales bacterium RIFCSPLOWO2_12_FULL_58_28]|nr:MAG: glycine--tRNA ligase subunit beta [Rhodospirillales bacterium RIFCSPLOWO2_02_FULL_58_16]OHC79667.1 MAG: glycine--tRNA ligase subunit beta [Rhodospirillales bacterium RIFCSPLOWO2_12_FULL_58_28]
MPELLLEIRSEEIPARMQAAAADDLKRLVTDGLKTAGLTFSAAHAYVTPRRLALAVEGLPLAQPDVKEEKRGPRADAPQAAIDGFLKAAGVTLDRCEKRETAKGAFLFAVVEKKGRPTPGVFSDILGPVILSFPWPKSMRWGSLPNRWVRPLQSIVILFNGKPVNLTVGSLEFSNTICGHRFHAPKPFTVKDFADYKSKLAHAKVMLDAAERRRVIHDQAERLASAEGLKLKADQGLLNEVAGLVEWPVALMGRIDDRFMTLPPEVLSTAMRSHQKYFSLLNADGSPAPRFIAVANIEATDGGKAIIAGNERVLRARLSDAEFFWNQDRKKRLEDRLPALAGRVFYKGLGSMFDKAERIAELAGKLAVYTGVDPVSAERAARLAKADLSCGMVGEFPELQGIMGGYYARADGEDEDAAEAVARHYAPQGPNDACPNRPLAVTVALADKIDTLVGFFGINEKPTGSKDPFALRRAALGVIRLIIENDLKMPLLNVFKTAHEVFGNDAFKTAPDKSAGELLSFFADRLKAHLKEKGVRHDLISAVFAVDSGEDDLVRLLARVGALQGFLDADDGANLLVAYRRAANILRIEEKKDGLSYNGVADEKLFAEDAERILFDCLATVGAKSQEALKDERFTDAMTELAGLRTPVDAFFDKVTVNCENPGLRGNRLKLLSQIRSALEGIADFSRIEGTEK